MKKHSHTSERAFVIDFSSFHHGKDNAKMFVMLVFLSSSS
jgi:hypothetical protein